MDEAYNKMRLALFVCSYGGWFMAKKLKNKYKNVEELTFEVNNLGRVLNFDSNLLRRFILSEKKPYQLSKHLDITQEEKEKISIYLRVENEILELVRQKENKNSLITHDYERAIVEPAIERVAGNKLSNVDDDVEFETKLEKSRRSYRNVYYKVAYRYKLPTIRILPFILRLITL